MKRPGISLSPAAIGGFFVNHGEKLAFGLVVAFALLLTWWGIDAVRSEAVGPDRTPKAVEQLARGAEENIERVRQVPPDRLPTRSPLPPLIDPWRPTTVEIAAAPPPRAFLDRPLFAELTKRTKPNVLPIEDLQAVAGIAVLPDPTARVDGPELAPRLPDLSPPREDEPRRRPPPRGRDRDRNREAEGGMFGLEGGLAPELTETFAVEPLPAGKITPFVVVTGLIPAAKQQQEYERRFGSASYRDPQRDQPRWAVYLVERTLVVPGANPRWQRMKVKDVERNDPGGRVGMAAMPGQPGADGGPAMESETLPQAFFLQAEETEIGYAAALPARIDDPWGVAAVHPWFAARLEEFLDADATDDEQAEVPTVALADLLAKPAARAGSELRLEGVTLEAAPERQRSVGLYKFAVRSADGKATAEIGDIGLDREPVFAVSEQWGRQLAVDGTSSKPQSCNLRGRVDMLGKTPVIRILEIEFLDADGAAIETTADPEPEPVEGVEGLAGGAMPEMPGVAAGRGLPLADNRLFRFLDTDVKPGETYRYRVKFALRNPNVRLAPRHLANAADAKEEFLVAEYSNETPPVRVPDPVALVARTIDKDTLRKLKIKGDALEVMVLAPSDKNGNFALRSTITDVGGLANVSMDLNRPGDTRFFGESVVTDRVLLDVRGSQSDRADIRSQEPPEPLEMVFLNPEDGSFEIVTAADSESRIRKYGQTLFKPGTTLPDDGKPERPDRRDRDADLPPRGFP
jgi:hypothetical protein